MTDAPKPTAAAIFEAALEVGAAERAAFVQRVCAGNAQLVSEVMGLLAADARAEGFLAAPPEVGALLQSLGADAPGSPEGDAAHPDLGRIVGRFRLLEEIGRGGMGTVFLAERASKDFDQHVAVKLIRRGMDTDELLQRFEHERRLLARLEHPNIARLLDGGATEDGRPYFVMEYVDGVPLDVHCDAQRLGLRERLRLFLDVCTAVQHAHRNLVVHRDLKPGNILVARDGTVKLLDFGIAKLVDPDEREVALTATHLRLLSPRYGSPEQMRGEPVTTASDVYSLGVVLYELLTGRSPYADDSGSLGDLERRVLEDEPTPPSTAVTVQGREEFERPLDVAAMRKALRGDLDTIVLEALRKEPQRRYTSVDEFAEDLRRYLEGRPVLARPDSFGYRAGKFLRRNALAVGAAAVVAVALLIATVVSTSLYVRADRAQALALQERATAERVSAFLQDVLGSIEPAEAGGADTTLMRRVLARTAARIDTELAGQPEVAASLHHTLGRAYHSLGALDEAEPHLLRARELWPAEPAVRATDRGYFYFDAGRYDEAIEELSAVALAGPTSGDLVNAARARYWWGKSLEARGDLEAAEPQLWAADAELRAIGEDRLRILVLGGIGGFLVNNQQRFATADSLYAVATALVESLGVGPLSAGSQYQSFATSKRRQNDLVAADSLYAVAHARYSEVLEDDHPQLASLQDEWAGALEQMGRYDEAEALYRKSLATMTKVFGDSHRMVGTVTNNLANLLRKTGRHDEAAPLFDEAVATYGRALGPDHLWVGIILGNVAANQLARGDHASALATAVECRRIRATHWPEGHWRIAAVDAIRGAALGGLGRFEEGEELLLASLRIQDEALGADSDASVAALDHLRELYRRWGRAAPPELVARW